MKDTDIRNIIIKNIEYIRNTFDKVYQINFDKNIEIRFFIKGEKGKFLII